MNDYVPQLSTRQARWLRFAGLIAGVLVLLALAERLSRVLNPILAALAAAYVLNPFVNWLEARRVNRLFAICCIYAVGSILMLLAALLLADTAIQQADRLTVWMHDAFLRASEWIKSRSPNLLAAASKPADWLRESGGPGMAVAGSVVAWVRTAFSNTAYWLSVVILFPMYSFFFLWRFNDIVRAIRDHVPAAIREVVVRVVGTIDRSMSEFFRGRLIVCSIVGVLTAMGWLIVGVPYSIPLGLMMGMLNLVPFLSVVGLPIALFVTFLECNAAGTSWFWPVGLALGVYLCVHAIESFVVAPYVMFHSAGLHPITIVVVLLIGAEVAGVFGMLLAIPLASTVKSLASEFLMPEIRRLARAPDADSPPGPVPH